MRAVDSNVLVRLLVRDDAVQARMADAFVARGAWVSHIVLVEAVWVLSAVYGRTPAEIANAIELLLVHEQLVLQDPEAVAAALAGYRRRGAPGFSDCLVLESARKAGHTPLGTFDRKLAKLDGAMTVSAP